MHPGGAIDLIARMATKPGRTGRMDCWVVHASAVWTRDTLDADRSAVPGLLLAEAEAALGRLPSPDHATAHRWLYSRTERPLGQPILASADGTLLLGGDWALGANAEHAYLSGQALADAVLAQG
jgi:predicted NAD/FAD-dependent oxidoreductase